MPWEPLRTSFERDPQLIGNPLDRVVKYLSGTESTSLHTIFSDWEEIVGISIAKHIQPVSLEKNCLIVKASDSSWASQFKFLEPGILEKLSARLGDNEIISLKLRISRR